MSTLGVNEEVILVTVVSYSVFPLAKLTFKLFNTAVASLPLGIEYILYTLVSTLVAATFYALAVGAIAYILTILTSFVSDDPALEAMKCLWWPIFL